MKDTLFNNEIAELHVGRSREQQERSIKPFQNWMDKVAAQSSQTKGPLATENNIVRRHIRFTNGPYAEIKELIGKISR